MNRGERRALAHYLARGYRPLAVNAWAGGYEVDLIVRRGARVVFVEVKEKRDARFDPLEMVDAEKRRRVRRAARAWLARRRDLAALEISFEVVGIRGGRLVRVRDDLTAP